jgi:hypothetical protein
MQYRITTSASNWVDVWLNKYALILEEKNLSAEDACRYRGIIRQYLTKNPGNPREIALVNLKEFVSVRKQDVLAPLILFYETAALSEKHSKVLAGIQGRKKKRHKRSAGYR